MIKIGPEFIGSLVYSLIKFLIENSALLVK
jgi:hypothetical protein